MADDLGGLAFGRAPAFGELAPLFAAETDGNPRYDLSVVGGRWLALMFLGSLSAPACRAAHDEILARRALFNDTDAACFAVSADAADRTVHGLANHACGVRYLWDFDLSACRLYGLVGETALRPMIFLLDRTMRVAAAGPIEATGAVLDELTRYLAAERAGGAAGFAPVLALPRVFERELCARLIGYFAARGGAPSGFAAAVDGRTHTIVDPRFKRRDDVTIEDRRLIEEIGDKIEWRLFPAIRRALGWRGGEVERFIVCRYRAEERGFFSAHRDDVVAGAEHRRFACTINLNSDYEGGDLRFPEFGRRTYRAEEGGAVVFCCSLLHEVTPVTRGERYAFTPFLCDSGAGTR